MSKLFIENPPKIYLKNSDKVRLADYRARIVKETNPREPCDNEDLVFVKAYSQDDIPEDAIYTWNMWNGNDRVYFYTTAERCKEMICIAPSCWTPEKLKYFADVEKKLYEAWLNGMVYGYIIEKWDEKRREWMQTSSLWGMYGAEELMMNLADATDGVSIPICLDEEDMKYDFDNTEKKVNEFDSSTPG